MMALEIQSSQSNFFSKTRFGSMCDFEIPCTKRARLWKDRTEETSNWMERKPCNENSSLFIQTIDEKQIEFENVHMDKTEAEIEEIEEIDTRDMMPISSIHNFLFTAPKTSLESICLNNPLNLRSLWNYLIHSTPRLLSAIPEKLMCVFSRKRLYWESKKQKLLTCAIEEKNELMEDCNSCQGMQLSEISDICKQESGSCFQEECSTKRKRTGSPCSVIESDSQWCKRRRVNCEG